MKNQLYSIRNIFALFLIFIFLIQQFGCSSSYSILNSDLPVSSIYKYKIHYKNASYFLENAVVSNGILSGKIDEEYEARAKSYIVQIYPTSDSVVKINSKMILSIPISGIHKVKKTEYSPGLTTLVVVGSVAAILVLLGVVAYQNMTFSLSGH